MAEHRPETDAARTQALTAAGFRVIRFWNNDALSNMDGVLTTIVEALAEQRMEDPHPDPLPQAGEGE